MARIQPIKNSEILANHKQPTHHIMPYKANTSCAIPCSRGLPVVNQVIRLLSVSKLQSFLLILLSEAFWISSECCLTGELFLAQMNSVNLIFLTFVF